MITLLIKRVFFSAIKESEVITMNEENLTPFNKMTVKQQREIAKKGGIASQKKRKERKLIKDQISLLLSLPLKDEKTKAKFKSLGIDSEDIDNQMAMVIAMWQKALKGDVNAFNTIRDTIGEKPVEQIQNLTPPTINIERPNKKK